MPGVLEANAVKVLRRRHFEYGLDLTRVDFYSPQSNDKPYLPDETMKAHFNGFNLSACCLGCMGAFEKVFSLFVLFTFSF